jgi:hypothetical protein
MRTPLIIIGALVIAVIIVYFIARRRIADNMRKTLQPYELEAGSDHPYFEDRGVKYDEEKYAEYLRGYVGKLPDAQIDYFIAGRSKRGDVWNVRFCDALRAEKERRAAEKDAASETKARVLRLPTHPRRRTRLRRRTRPRLPTHRAEDAPETEDAPEAGDAPEKEDD